MYVQNSRSTNLVACQRGNLINTRGGRETRNERCRCNASMNQPFPVLRAAENRRFFALLVSSCLSVKRRFAWPQTSTEKELHDTHTEHCALVDRVAAFPPGSISTRDNIFRLFRQCYASVFRPEHQENSLVIQGYSRTPSIRIRRQTDIQFHEKLVFLSVDLFYSVIIVI